MIGLITKHLLAAILVLPILAASHVQAGRPAGQQASRETRSRSLLNTAKADWFALRTKSAEQGLIAATKFPDTAAEAHYWLGRIYEFKGNAEGMFPGFHEEVSYRARAEAEFKAAGTPKPEWALEAQGFANALKAADAAIVKLQSDSQASGTAIRQAIEYRIKLRPDPMSYVIGANLLLARNTELPFVLQLAGEGQTAGERFIRENESSYKLDGKVQASLDRNAATFADLAGFVLYRQGDIAGAETRLAEAARLFRNNDINNQLHLAELSVSKGDRSTAEDHYLNVIELAYNEQSAEARARAQAAVLALRAKTGESADESKAWLTEMLDRKREQRRNASISNMQGRRLPNLVLKDLQGNNVDLRAERGNVVLLNFFASWSGACRAELPLIQKAYEKYQGTPGVKFILVSIDDDPARLEKYVAERKFAMPVLRYNSEQAAKIFNVHDTPTTFYVDTSGTIQFQVTGTEPHGDAVERVSWYIERLRGTEPK